MSKIAILFHGEACFLWKHTTFAAFGKKFPSTLDFFLTILYNIGTNNRKVGLPMKAVITVTGKDSVGIIAEVAGVCAQKGANILDITQTVLSDYFAMIMLASIDELKIDFSDFVDTLAALGKSKGLDIHTMHEDIFNTMHHI